jgi:type I restriction enzyme S subunit
VATIASNLVDPRKFPALPHAAPDNIEKGTGRLISFRSVEEDGVRSPNHYFRSGQILYSKIRPNLKKAVLIDFDGLCSADMYPINSHVDPAFLAKYMISRPFLGMTVRNDTRVAMPKINQDESKKVLVPVPPLAEQRRIVAKLDVRLSLCDCLEKGLIGLDKAAKRLLSRLVSHLLGPDVSTAK